jgi:hypothetical protein
MIQASLPQLLPTKLSMKQKYYMAADAIVSFNTKDFGDAPERFGIEVLLPRDALARIRALNH